MALVSINGRVDHRWVAAVLSDKFPNHAFWINFHPLEGEYMLHFAKRRNMGTDEFVAHSFPINFDEEGFLDLAVTKLMLVT